MNSLRIAVVAYNHPECTLPLVKHLAKKGHHVDYFYVTFYGCRDTAALSFGRKVRLPGIRRMRRGGRMRSAYEYVGSTEVNIWLVVLPPLSRVLCLYSAARMLFRCFGRVLNWRRYDWINVVGQNPPLLDLVQSLGSRKNLCASLHEVSAHYAGQKTDGELLAYLLSHRVPIVAHSEASRSRILSHPHSSAEHIEVIPFGVFETYSLFSNPSRGIGIEGPYILFFGRILPYKGLDVLYKAVQMADRRLGNVKIVVAGAGSDPFLRQMAADSRFHLINRKLANEEVVQLHRQAYCVVCPYKSASQSGIVCTSFYFGKPILASDVGAFGEYVAHGENGLLVPPENPKALSESLVLLMNDAPLYERLSKGASEFGQRGRFSWDHIAQRYIDLFLRSCGQPSETDGSEGIRSRA